MSTHIGRIAASIISHVIHFQWVPYASCLAIAKSISDLHSSESRGNLTGFLAGSSRSGLKLWYHLDRLDWLRKAQSSKGNQKEQEIDLARIWNGKIVTIEQGYWVLHLPVELGIGLHPFYLRSFSNEPFYSTKLQVCQAFLIWGSECALP